MIDPTIVGKRLAEALTMPPGGPLLIAAIGLVLIRRHPRLGRAVAAVGVTLALICSTEGMSDIIARDVEGSLTGLTTAALTDVMKSEHPPGAIVVLSGGQTYDERDQPAPDTLLGRSLSRTLQGARVAKVTGLPILVSGGAVYSQLPPEAQTMARVLRDDLGVAPRWIESGSYDTVDNANQSARIMRQEGIDTVILVTDALHMRRSIAVFERAGLHVVAAPVGFSGTRGGDRSFDWLPTIVGSNRFWAAFHELIGMWWYDFRFRSSPSTPTTLNGNTR